MTPDTPVVTRHVHGDQARPWAPAGIFVGGSEPQKGPPQDKKGPLPKKNCASTVLREL